jgi:hypothetical protein
MAYLVVTPKKKIFWVVEKKKFFFPPKKKIFFFLSFFLYGLIYIVVKKNVFSNFSKMHCLAYTNYLLSSLNII